MSKISPQTNVLRDYLEVHVGADWIDYFNVQEDDYLVAEEDYYLDD